jgi:CheY-like chemotaxis protein
MAMPGCAIKKRTCEMTQDSSGNSSDPSDEIGDSIAEPLVDDTDGSLKASILIVDDDRGQRLLMRKVLEQKGFEVIEAPDGVEACRLNEEHHPDLLLVDLMMPHMDGYELCRKLRSQTCSANVPIVVTRCDRLRPKAGQLARSEQPHPLHLARKPGIRRVGPK